MLFKRLATGSGIDLERREDAHEHLLEALQVPVLIDDCVDNAREEYLLRFVCKQIHQVVHLVDGLEVGHVLLAPLRQELLTEKIHQILDVLVVGEVDVLAWVRETHLDLVHQRSTHGNGHGLNGGLL